ncbi:MAG: CPBP family intramembrane metalloprotease [Candidatus Hydrothermarchaeota archaeon]|nr:CPBP family intramembrane metalloprotease [Candidatus Hydrothermarchaeota archaeon]
MLRPRLSVLFLLSIFLAITLLEYVFTYTDIAYGIILALFLTIFIYVVVSMPRFETDATRAAESLALIPLYVLFTSSLPWFFIKQEYVLPAVYSIILGLCFLHVYEKGISLEDAGLKTKNWFKLAVIGSLIGIPTGIAEYLVLLPEPAFPVFQIHYFLRDCVYMVLFVGLAEELLFRGIIQTDLQKIFGKLPGLLSASYLFGIMHLTWRSLPELLFTFWAGCLLGYVYNRTNSLTAPIFLHGVNNVMLVAVLPYLGRL